MELQFHGANCISIDTKKAKIVIDDNLEKLGLSSVSKKATANLFSQERLVSKTDKDSFVIDGPGEYELSQVAIHGIPARAHTDEEGQHNATIYRVVASSIILLSLGHVYPDLSDEQLEHIGMIDVLVLPVGGNGYTLDAEGAAKMIKKIEPKIVIPTHYQDKKVDYEVPQNELEPFLKEVGAEAHKEDKLKLKSNSLPDVMTVYQLTRS